MFNSLLTIDDMWMKDIFRSPLSQKIESELKKMTNKGLPSIQKPHNLYVIKDDDGNIIANKLEVVTTPFAKDEVSVVLKDNVLQVKCGTKKEEKKTTEETIFHGISSQSYSFSLQLSEKVDRENVKAENKDGILTVVFPFKHDKKEDEIVLI